MSTEKLVVSLVDTLDAHFAQYVTANQAKGLVYGLVGPDGLVHSQGFGQANQSGRVPMSDTVFPIASMSKSFVACAAVLARDRGLINLEAPITDFFPQFSGSGTFDEPHDPPTIRMLLSMSGGLTEDNSWVDPFIGMPVAELLDRIAPGLVFSSPPGSTFEYSNLGFTLAGLAVGKAVGARIEDWIREELLIPLGLSNTRFDNDTRAAARHLATGYALDATGEWAPFSAVSSDAFAAAGGLRSTISDLAAWITWLGSAFRPTPNADHVMSRASRRELQRLHSFTQPAVAARPEGTWKINVGGYGLGLVITEDLHRGTLVAHSGGLPGFLLHMVWHPDSGHGIVVLTNSHRGNPIALAEEAVFRVLDRHATPARTVRLWPATVELRLRAESLIRTWDDGVAAEIFAENIDFDRPIDERRAEIEQLVAEIGPLGPARPMADVVSAVTPADLTWAIPGRTGELICMIHLTPVQPARIQEFEVRAVSYDLPRVARPDDISPRRRGLGPVSLASLHSTRVELPFDLV